MPDLEGEQQHLDRLHRRLDAERERVAGELAGVLRETGGTRQALGERTAQAARLRRAVARYEAAESGLCFGRLDLLDGVRRYLGRVGLQAEDGDVEPLLVDWRAPAARAFYTATAAAPQGVRLRRYLHTRGRRLVAIDDELLGGPPPEPGELELNGEAALLAALSSGRTGRMRDAVGTLQAEQDRIIRAPHSEVLVVQGGPGTGKTVVALHRAAYLLYTQPRLDERGVLVVGPNPVFLDYVGDVLPGLGETGVLMSTVAGLFPGVEADREEPPEVAAVKGRTAMADVVAAALAARQASVAEPVRTPIGGDEVVLDPALLRSLAAAALASGAPHNPARRRFAFELAREVSRRLARAVADLEAGFDAELSAVLDVAALDRAAAADLDSVFGAGPEPDEDAEDEFAEAEAYWMGELPADDAFLALLDALWPALTPQRLLEDLFASADRLAEAAPDLADRELLLRSPGAGWTAADVPLLDEAAELLGVDDTDDRRRAAAERARELEYAQGVLDIAHGSRAQEADAAEAQALLLATDVVDAEQLARRSAGADLRTVAERAAEDRTWAFGHVVVDEAQELSPMAWRLLERRCPSRSFSVFGDMAQTGAAAGASSWTEALGAVFGDRWRLERLTVNYRTPEEIMSAAQPVLAAIGPELGSAHAVTRGAPAPWRRRVPDLAAELGPLVAAEVAAVPDGRVAVIAADPAPLAAALPGASSGPGVDLARTVVVLTPRQAKGLEFDSVVIVEPDAIVAASPRGRNDLYVALTRPARRLAVLHTTDEPAYLGALRSG